MLVSCFDARRTHTHGGTAHVTAHTSPFGGVGKGALATGQSQEAGLTTLMLTRHLHREAARRNFFKKNFPHDTHQNDQRIVGIILGHVCWGTSGPPPPPPNLLRWPVGGARPVSPEVGGGGVWKRGSNDNPQRANLSSSTLGDSGESGWGSRRRQLQNRCSRWSWKDTVGAKRTVAVSSPPLPLVKRRAPRGRGKECSCTVLHRHHQR